MTITTKIELLTNLVNKENLQSNIFRYLITFTFPNGAVKKEFRQSFIPIENEERLKLNIPITSGFINYFIECFKYSLVFGEDNKPYVIQMHHAHEVTEKDELAYSEWLKTTTADNKSKSYFYTFERKFK